MHSALHTVKNVPPSKSRSHASITGGSGRASPDFLHLGCMHVDLISYNARQKYAQIEPLS